MAKNDQMYSIHHIVIIVVWTECIFMVYIKQCIGDIKMA